jgi:DNA-directed RNA polymerase specialized sigma24 family protein
VSDEVGYAIIEKLNLLIKLSALSFLKDKEFKEQVRVLADVGLPPKEIAELLGKTANNVRVTLSTMRRAKKKRTPKTLNQLKDRIENE